MNWLFHMTTIHVLLVRVLFLSSGKFVARNMHDWQQIEMD